MRRLWVAERWDYAVGGWVVTENAYRSRKAARARTQQIRAWADTYEGGGGTIERWRVVQYKAVR